MPTSTAEWTTGRWSWLLQEFGIDATFLVNKHGPCPMCGGKDRFRFDDKAGKGTWFCNGCGSGDGFDLIERFTKGEFKAIAALIDKMRGDAPEPQEFRPEASVELKREGLNRLWSSGNDPSILTQYFKSRWLDYITVANLTDVRGNPEVMFLDEEMGRADFPAMLAMVRNAKGEPISIHRTYLMKDGMRVKKLMPPTEKITGGAIRLRPIADGALIVAEGIETALAGKQLLLPLRDCGIWAAISANGLRELDVPSTVTHLFICADIDKSFTGQAAAYELARRMKVRKEPPSSVMVVHPNELGDMADVLKSKTMSYVEWRNGEIT